MHDEKSASATDYVKRQYKDTTRLNTRLNLYEKYGDPDTPSFHQWVFERLNLKPGDKVLDVGCGTGALWVDTRDRWPDRIDVTLADNAPAMIEAVKRDLPDSTFNYEEAGITALPWPDGSFDVVIANHVLYHVADRQQALGEVRRVLRPGGRFYASTNSWTHLIELRQLVEEHCSEAHMMPAGYVPDFFDLQNGARELESEFGNVQMVTRHGQLLVSNAADLEAYVRSTVDAHQRSLKALREAIEWRIGIEGHFYLTLCAGLLWAECAAD